MGSGMVSTSYSGYFTSPRVPAAGDANGGIKVFTWAHIFKPVLNDQECVAQQEVVYDTAA